MALSKTISLDTGLEVSYHRIISLALYWIQETGTIVVGSYMDRQRRIDAPKTGVADTRRITIPEDVFKAYLAADSLPNDSISDPEESNELDRTLAYQLVQMLDEDLSDATDVLE